MRGSQWAGLAFFAEGREGAGIICLYKQLKRDKESPPPRKSFTCSKEGAIYSKRAWCIWGYIHVSLVTQVCCSNAAFTIFVNVCHLKVSTGERHSIVKKFQPLTFTWRGIFHDEIFHTCKWSTFCTTFFMHKEAWQPLYTLRNVLVGCSFHRLSQPAKHEMFTTWERLSLYGNSGDNRRTVWLEKIKELLKYLDMLKWMNK